MKVELINATSFENDIYGIPVDVQYLFANNMGIEYIPERVLSFYQLNTLRMNYNKISEIPSDICKMSKLEMLDLGNNCIEDIPSDICMLSSLSHLWLENNNISVVPDFITDMSNLQSLDLSGNPITRLPEDIGKMSLQSLSLVGCNIPDSEKERIIKALPNTEIYFDDNGF